jgi:DNA-binding transcriptional LysR family regulator
MDRFEAMSVLLEVVDSGSFSAAGRRLHMPVTTIARKISDLETALGAKLLIRTTRKLSLTDAGTIYLAAARRIVDQVDEAEREVAGEFTVPKGELVITAPVQFGQLHVLPVVADFLAAFPEITIRLLLQDRNVHLVEDHVDMAVRIGSLADSSMIATSVGSMRMVFCATPQLLAQNSTPKSPEDLQNMPLIAFEGPIPSAGWRFVDPQTKLPMVVPVAARLSVTTAEAAVRAALMHVGVTRLLHYQAADAVKAGTLQLILESFEPEPIPVSLVHVGRGQMPLKLRSFMDFALPKLRQSLLDLSKNKTKM